MVNKGELEESARYLGNTSSTHNHHIGKQAWKQSMGTWEHVRKHDGQIGRVAWTSWQSPTRVVKCSALAVHTVSGIACRTRGNVWPHRRGGKANENGRLNVKMPQIKAWERSSHDMPSL